MRSASCSTRCCSDFPPLTEPTRIPWGTSTSTRPRGPGHRGLPHAARPSGLVMKCLAKSPDERFQRGTELADALIAYLGQAGTPSLTALLAGSPHRLPASPGRLQRHIGRGWNRYSAHPRSDPIRSECSDTRSSRLASLAATDHQFIDVALPLPLFQTFTYVVASHRTH